MDAVIALVDFGYSFDRAMKFTPRQIVTLLKAHEKRRRMERADLLALITLGSRGESKEVEKQMRRLLHGS